MLLCLEECVFDVYCLYYDLPTIEKNALAVRANGGLKPLITVILKLYISQQAMRVFCRRLECSVG